MFNLTGMVETDLYLINKIFISIKSKKEDEMFEKFNIPIVFKKLEKYFITSYFKYTFDDNGVNLKHEIDAIDELLWRWKSPLSLEWYPYLLGLKQDLLLLFNKVSSNRSEKPKHYL